MAGLHADNFNYFGDDESLLLNGLYAEATQVTLVADPDGVTPEKCLRFAAATLLPRYRWVLPASHATVGMMSRIWLDQLPYHPDVRPRVAEWRDGSNNTIAYVYVTTTGGLAFVNGSNATVAPDASSDGPVVGANGWYHIESKLVCDLANGATVEVRVEGVPALTHDTFSTSVATSAQIAQVNYGTLINVAIGWQTKDLAVWDGSGAENNDFIGSAEVFERLPVSDVAMNWDSTGANGFGVLDNNPPDDGVSFISAPFPAMPAASVFGLTPLPDDVTSVKFQLTRVRAAKSDGGDGQLQVSLRSGVADDAGANRAITVAQTYWSDISELDPATGTAWLPNNSAELVLDRTL